MPPMPLLQQPRGGSRRHTGPVPGATRSAHCKEGATVIPMSAQELKLRGQSDLAPVTLQGGGGQGLPGQSPLPPNPVGQTRTRFWSFMPFIALLKSALTDNPFKHGGSFPCVF